MPAVNPGQIYQENDPRITRFVKIKAVNGETVFMERVNEDGSPYPRSRVTEANLFRFGSFARGKYKFIRDAT